MTVLRCFGCASPHSSTRSWTPHASILSSRWSRPFVIEPLRVRSRSPMAHTITLIPGDGIGPEVAKATQRVLEASGVAIEWDVQEAGAAVAEKRGTTLPDEVLASVRKNKVALKGPIGTPIGKGFRSVNVTLRQTLDLYANVRPVRSLPNVDARFDVDMVIVRENTEGLYAGLELMILPGIAQSIKLVTEKS